MKSPKSLISKMSPSAEGLRLLVAVVLVACDGGVHHAEPVACDPVADEGCPAGTHCRLLGGGALACLPPSTAIAAGSCEAGSCQPGEACVAVEGQTGCRPVCRVDDPSCPDAGLCSHAVADGFGVCTTPCTLGGCSLGGTCAPISATPYPVCVAAGDAQPGEACAERRCAAGLACLALEGDPRCERLCTPEGGQPCAGQCTGLIADHDGLRFCAP
ncbi:MAG: hypothetical protein R3F60_05635 [bacterium]